MQACSICIGVITRNRRQMLEQLLKSMTALVIPTELRVTFVVVENAAAHSLEDICWEFKQSVPQHGFVYEIEPRLGIPSARNRVLDIADRLEADLVTFVDDDETVDSQWLQSIVAEQQRRNLDLVGGPVRLRACDASAGRMQRRVWQGMAQEKMAVESRGRQAWSDETDGRIALATNNWLAKCSFLRQHGLRFDERLGFSGGSDTTLYDAAKRAGGTTGWAPDAIVYEHIIPSRLTVRYLFRRAADQTIASTRRKHGKLRAGIMAKSMLVALYKSLSAAVLLCATPFDDGQSFCKSVSHFGNAAGRISLVLGGTSQHYREVHGQ